MALIKCPECGKEISDQVTKCIHCGCPLKKEGNHIRKIILPVVLGGLGLCIVLILIPRNGNNIVGNLTMSEENHINNVSAEARALIDLIDSIQEVDLEDELTVGKCEQMYYELSEEEREAISNLDVLSDARSKIDSILAVHPIPFSDAQWGMSKKELIELLGKPDSEEENPSYGKMLVYKNVENEGYKGRAKYALEDDKLTRVIYFIDEYDKKIQEYFNELFESKYGKPLGADGNRWDTKYVLCFTDSSPMYGGFVSVWYMSPKLLEEQ